MKRAQPELGAELTAAEAERFLLQNLEEEKESPRQALWQLAMFYKDTEQYKKALVYLGKLVALAPDVEANAIYVLNMGACMECAGDYSAAVRYYKEALALKPTGSVVRYFINNNLGFSLNTFGDFAEGEIYCRKAIEIDHGRPNGHKNLGIALAGQGCYQEAAECFVAATQVDALDSRAFNLLTQLLESHPDLEIEFGDVARLCGEAIKQARATNTH